MLLWDFSQQHDTTIRGTKLQASHTRSQQNTNKQTNKATTHHALFQKGQRSLNTDRYNEERRQQQAATAATARRRQGKERKTSRKIFFQYKYQQWLCS